MPVITDQIPAPDRKNPIFDSKDITVIFVLGGPGAGKGTQCANLVKDFGFKHLSAGDLLRAEQDREGSQFGDMIKEYIRDGKIVPMEVTVQLLENAMREAIDSEGKKMFLIDGMTRFLLFSLRLHVLPHIESTHHFCRTMLPTHFLSQPTGFPRKMDQAQQFERTVCLSRFTLFFDCPEDTMQERLLNRGKTSGRSDDNAESIKKRFKTFVETSMPVVDNYEKEGKVVKVDATKSPEEVYEETKKKIKDRGIE